MFLHFVVSNLQCAVTIQNNTISPVYLLQITIIKVTIIKLSNLKSITHVAGYFFLVTITD